MPATASTERVPNAQDIKQSTRPLSIAGKPEAETMPPRDDEFKQSMTMMAQAITAMAQAQTQAVQAKPNGNGKSFSDKLAQFFPSLLLILGMGWTVAKTDGTRQITIDSLQTQINTLIDRSEKAEAKTEQMMKLYLIRFGQDPMQVDTSKPVRRK